MTATGVFMGKVNYAAPELVLGDVKSQSYTTDIYALGILLYQLCAGHLPFSGTDQDILSANLRSSLPMKDIKGSDFKRIIRKATEKVQSKRYASAAELRVDLERVSNNKEEIDFRKVGTYSCIALVVIGLLIGGILLLDKDSDGKTKIIAKQPTCEEIYHGALSMLNKKDSVHLQARGKELLCTLAEDSLYFPAKMKYYVMLLNSINPEEVKKGFTELERIALNDSTNNVALFECGLTLSKGNRFFDVPTRRQSFLKIDMDLDKANQLLYKSMKADTTDYKSVYWAFNNLMEKKLVGTLPASEEKKITTLYKLFEERIDAHKDATADIYKNAIKSDGETLRAWGLLK